MSKLSFHQKSRLWSQYWPHISKTCRFCNHYRGITRSLIPIDVSKQDLVYRCHDCKEVTKTTLLDDSPRNWV